MRNLVIGFLLAALAILHVVSLEKTAEGWNTLPRDDSVEYVMPSPLLKVISLDYDGLVADYLFIKGMVFLGGHIGEGKKVVLSSQEWLWINHIFQVSSDLDPYFIDPYYAGNAYLTWDGGMVVEANALLEKGGRYRDWDWTLPFFIGFNHFFFLQDYDKAAEHLMEASRRPGASPTLVSLASKLAFKAKKTESSILFLEEIIKKTDDESMKKLFETRQQAFKAILVLEKAVDEYREKFGRRPRTVNELIRKEVIAELPIDPYGGKLYIDSSGTVKSTSERELMPHRKK